MSALAALGGGLMVTTAVAAQDSGAQGMQMSQPAMGAMDISDSDLEAFAEAQQAVADVIARYQEQGSEIETEEQMAALQQEANDAATEALGDTDLSPEEFNQIAMALQNDPELQQRYLSVVQQ